LVDNAVSIVLADNNVIQFQFQEHSVLRNRLPLLTTLRNLFSAGLQCCSPREIANRQVERVPVRASCCYELQCCSVAPVTARDYCCCLADPRIHLLG
jgi:hypothetical protein